MHDFEACTKGYSRKDGTLGVTSCSTDASRSSSARHMKECGLLIHNGRMVRRCGWRHALDRVEQHSSSDAPGVGTSSLETLLDVEEEAESVGEPGASSLIMRSASSIEKV